MATVPLKIDMFDEDVRPRDWEPRKLECRGPLKFTRICILGIIFPALLVAGPVYLRYRVYAEQLYPLGISDQRLIDSRVSTTWCQRQIIRVNTTFNAYLMNGEPKINREVVPVSMTRHLVLEDDMKEYWGFYLLRGSSVTVSTCVRYPGASLTIIRGHKHLHECAFIGDDSSEELDEMLEIAQERGLLNGTGLLQVEKTDSPSNVPNKMKRVRQGVRFLLQRGNSSSSVNSESSQQHSSRELDTKALRAILAELSARKEDTKKKQQQNPHHHYEGVFRESKNIERPPVPPQQARKPPAKVFKKENKLQHAVKPTTDPLSSPSSAEVFQEVLKQINSLGSRGQRVVEKLVNQFDRSLNNSDFHSAIGSVMANSTLTLEQKIRRRRELVLSSRLGGALNAEDDDGDVALEEEDLHPDGIAEDRGTVNESTLNDRSNSEFWSSFSSSEERLLECKGLILNLPLTPHQSCSPAREHEHLEASVANAVTYRVPIDGYYFFVFSSENEVQPNFVRIQFDLLKTAYNTTDHVHSCTNSTAECALPFNFFSWERTVLELPLTGNDSAWNQEYVVISHCEPRTAVYCLCIVMVPVLILFFAFH